MTKKKLPLMPKATAVWLIDNTTLTFQQIAKFCGMHELEIKGIADGEVARGIIGIDPISSNQLTQAELDRCMKDPTAELKILISAAYESSIKGKSKKKSSKYTPIARRQDKPDAIFWLIKNFPTLSDSKIIKLIGTTKSTVDSIRDRSHWNIQNIRPRDPVLLGICNQTDLDKVIENEKLEQSSNEILDKDK